jgi:HD-GYP domain-containing protein (c-di-GMP phosphodiesterase class II)
MAGMKVFLRPNDLKTGMIIAEDLIENNIVLASKGTIVTQAIIDKLNQVYFLNKIAVFHEDNQSRNNQSVERSKTVEEVEKSFSEFTFNVEGIFDVIDSRGIKDLEEIRGFAKKIQNEMNSTRAIIKNIVLNGSGADTIYRHSVNVAALSSILGRWIGLDEKDINLLTYAGILHDFGKTRIDKQILNKRGTLTTKEFHQIKNHPITAYNLIKQVAFLDSSVCYGVLMHHERLDGSGYPLGIKGEKIHEFAKIIAIADTFDAVNSNRMHRRSRGPFAALEIIQKDSLGKLDYEYCKVFLEHLVNYYMGEEVLLNNEMICKIIQININDIIHPLVLHDAEFIDLKKQPGLRVERIIR